MFGASLSYSSPTATSTSTSTTSVSATSPLLSAMRSLSPSTSTVSLAPSPTTSQMTIVPAPVLPPPPAPVYPLPSDTPDQSQAMLDALRKYAEMQAQARMGDKDLVVMRSGDAPAAECGTVCKMGNWWSGQSTGMKFAVVGGGALAVGGIAWLIKKAVKK